jgi:predicted MFS family arabinose efflux permease
VSCAWGISNIGYVMIVYGVTHSITAILAGYNMKPRGRLFTVWCAIVLQICIIVTLLIWKPEPGDIMIFFSIAGVWGIVDAVWLVQTNGKKFKVIIQNRINFIGPLYLQYSSQNLYSIHS